MPAALATRSPFGRLVLELPRDDVTLDGSALLLNGQPVDTGSAITAHTKAEVAVAADGSRVLLCDRESDFAVTLDLPSGTVTSTVLPFRDDPRDELCFVEFVRWGLDVAVIWETGVVLVDERLRWRWMLGLAPFIHLHGLIDDTMVFSDDLDPPVTVSRIGLVTSVGGFEPDVRVLTPIHVDRTAGRAWSSTPTAAGAPGWESWFRPGGNVAIIDDDLVVEAHSADGHRVAPPGARSFIRERREWAVLCRVDGAPDQVRDAP